ncbi:Uncharacterised protein [Mycobacterium tuberculosis]|nr:Uncharacterised protein [Mycobacterium tuberculosis]
MCRLVGDNADWPAVDAPEPHHDVLGVTGLYLQEFVVEEPGDHLVHVIGLVGRVRDQRIQFEVLVGEVLLDGPCRGCGLVSGRVGGVVGRQVAQQLANVVEGVLFARCGVVCRTRLGHVGVGAAEFFHGDFLAGDGLDDVGPGDEHLAGLIDHDHEVGQGGGVDVPTGGGSHDQRDLRDDAGGQDVVAKDTAVQAQRDDTFLDARASTVVDADERTAGLDRQFLDLDDFLAVHLAKAAAKHRGVLAEDAHVAPVDGAVAGDHAVAERAFFTEIEVGAAVFGQRVQLDERILIQQRVDTLASRQLALGVYFFDGILTDGVQRLFPAFVQLRQLARGGVDVDGVLGGPLCGMSRAVGNACHGSRCYRLPHTTSLGWGGDRPRSAQAAFGRTLTARPADRCWIRVAPT